MKSGGYRGPKTPGAVYKHRRYWVGYENKLTHGVHLYAHLGNFKTLGQAQKIAKTIGQAGTVNTIFEDYEVWLYGERIGGTPYRAVQRVRVTA